MYSLIQVPNLQWSIAAGVSQPTSQTQQAVHPIETQSATTESPTETIRDTVSDLLVGCDIPMRMTPYDTRLHELCIQEGREKGYPVEEVAFTKYLRSGVIVSSTAYGHIKDEATSAFIAIYTGLATWMDDVYTTETDDLDVFHDRFLSRERQCNEALESFANVLREIKLHYHSVQSNLILASTLNFVNAIILEHRTKDMVLSPSAKSYATYQRISSGISEAYAMFIFPPEIPVGHYVQAIPEICLVINYFNDVLSFFKEERAGESGNYISNEAAAHQVDKLSILRILSQDLVLCVSRIKHMLEGSVEAHKAFQDFLEGYVSFHASFDARYHLSELFSS